MEPLVSAVIRTYNRENYLREAIESVLSQTYTHLEIVVVDVGSTDKTPNLLRSFGNQISHFKYDSRDHLAAMNFAVEKASGRYLLLLDDDDKVLPDTVAKEVAVVKQNPKVKVVFGRWRYILNGDGEVVLRESSAFSCQNMFEKLLAWNRVLSCGVLVDRQALLEVGGYDHSLTSCIDWDLWLRLAYRGYQFHCLDDFVGLVRVHRGNVQGDQVKMLKGCVEIIEKMNDMLESTEEKAQYGIRRRLSKVHLAMGVVLKESGRVWDAVKQFVKAAKYGSILLCLIPPLITAALILDKGLFRKLRKDVCKRELPGDPTVSHFI